jgi:hypothetical protein
VSRSSIHAGLGIGCANASEVPHVFGGRMFANVLF